MFFLDRHRALRHFSGESVITFKADLTFEHTEDTVSLYSIRQITIQIEPITSIFKKKQTTIRILNLKFIVVGCIRSSLNRKYGAPTHHAVYFDSILCYTNLKLQCSTQSNNYKKHG